MALRDLIPRSLNAVFEHGAHQRLLESNFNKVQCTLPPNEIFLSRDLKTHVDNVIEMIGNVGFENND